MPPRQSWKVSFRFEDERRQHEGERHGTEGTVPCARGENCSAATITGEGKEQTRTPALGRGPWCRKDTGRAWRCLAGMPELWVRLHGELGAKGQQSERVRMSRSAPLPLRADVDALLREHLYILASWDERVREAQRLTLPDTETQRLSAAHGRQVQAFSRLLAAHLAALLALPPGPMARTFPLHDLERIPEGAPGRTHYIAGYAEVIVDLSGADAGEEILRLHHRARSLLGETRMRERLSVPCPDPSCDLLMLERVQGSDYSAECGACGRLLSEAEYRTWVNLYANSLSEAEIAQRLAVA